MTPRKKAGELFDKYYNPLINLTTDMNYQNYLYKKDLCIKHAKKCALISVDEILDKDGYNNDYWKEVKQEIEAL